MQTLTLTNQSTQSVKDSSRQQAPPKPNLAQPAAQGQPIVELTAADAQRTWAACGCAREPFFPVNSGDLLPGTQVTIASPAQDAVIFYTTDGWTPTEASPRYTGPITINSETRLQAIAEEPNKLPSIIVEVVYTLKGSPAPTQEKALAGDGILRKGTPLRLVTGAEISSDSAQVGDRIPLLLDENVMAGETIVARKGSPVEATITRVDRAGQAGKPGVLVFQVQSLHAHGVTVPLTATLTLAAPDKAAQAQRLSNPSMVHVAGALPPGDEAEIEPGMALTASVGADTPLHP